MKKSQDHVPPGYRPDIDGLRAIAVLLVIAYHYWPARVAGGFIGVDVFFVISGYLISGIILKELELGSFTLIDFYSRRVRRIFPALTAALVFCLAAGKLILFKDEFKVLGKHVVAGAGFLSNILLWKEVSYWDGAAQEKPLLHLWSLGIEEQFYIIWPLTLWGFWKLWRDVRIPVIGGILLSFAANIFFMHSKPSAVFYLPVPRFWELLIGALCALVSRGQLGAWGDYILAELKTKNWVAWIGLLLIFICAAMLSPGQVFPGWYGLLPTAGTACILLSSPRNWLNSRILSFPSLVSIGLTSYPLYLWHWPLISFTHIIHPAGVPPTLLVVLLAATFILSIFTFRIIEPARYPPHAPLFLMAGMTLVIAAGSLVWNGTILPRSANADVERVIAAKADWEWPPKNITKQGLYYRLGDAPDSVFFLGDSNMIQYLPRIERIASEPGSKSAIFLADGGCPPLPDIPGTGEKCNQLVTAAEELTRNFSVKRVVLAALWQKYFNAQLDAKTLEESYKKLETLLIGFREKGIEVYVVLSIPSGPEFDLNRLISRSLFSAQLITEIVPPARSVLEAERALVSARIREISGRAGAKVIDPFDYLCDQTFCPQRDPDGEYRYMNGDHLANSFVREKITYLDKLLH